MEAEMQTGKMKGQIERSENLGVVPIIYKPEIVKVK
jgi:hypothetical protein